MEFPELKKAIDAAHTIELVQPGSTKYSFRAFAFGERGTKITAELLKEVPMAQLEGFVLEDPEVTGEVHEVLERYRQQ